MTIKAVVFDFGGVLIDWDREYLYKQLIPDDVERRWFLDNVCKMDWVVQQDGGQTTEEGRAELIALYPEHEALIRAFYARWPEMVSGVLEEGVALVDRLKAEGMPLFGLTNWPAQTFPYAWERFDVLRGFREVIVSELVFIDNDLRNAQAVTLLGWHGGQYTGAMEAETRLRELGVRI